VASDDGLTREQLLRLVEDQRHDFETLNQILNTQATAFGWCDEYEERIEKYNREFRVSRVVGRFPEGTAVTARNAYAARRLIMGHVINTLQRYGIAVPDGCWGGVVRDHKALAAAHDTLIEHLKEEHCDEC
jgi:hypothetical protein